MSLAVVHSRALMGVGAPEVRVETYLANGLPAFNLVGLPEMEVREARDRVRAAILTAHYEFPMRRITVSLAPADLPKESGRFDLPIALGILAASGQVPLAALADYEFAGELALSGELRPVRGALVAAIAAKQAGHKLILPQMNADEATLIRETEIYPAANLSAVCAHLTGQAMLSRHPHTPPAPWPEAQFDLNEVKGQQPVKRALEVAAAGGHSLLMVGPPGTGKSMLAARLAGILPPLTEQEALESAVIQSLVTQGFDARRFGLRPHRSPHHTASAASIVGGGANPRPGEISLAHHGVLFLDELPEFDRKVLEVLREPLEARKVLISRVAQQVEYPAGFQLVAAMNPCPCGYRGHPSRACTCSPQQVSRYIGRLSGPLLDRIDLIVEVPAVPQRELAAPARGEASASVRERVVAARARQAARHPLPNAHLPVKALDDVIALGPAEHELLTRVMEKLEPSARAYHRILRVARTIADLADSAQVQSAHLAEAIQYRRSL